MHITFYKSRLCPRCHLTDKYLREIVSNDPEIKVEEVDIMVAPKQSWRDGIRMVPALRIDHHILSKLFLSRTNIADFIARHKH